MDKMFKISIVVCTNEHSSNENNEDFSSIFSKSTKNKISCSFKQKKKDIIWNYNDLWWNIQNYY